MLPHERGVFGESLICLTRSEVKLREHTIGRRVVRHSLLGIGQDLLSLGRLVLYEIEPGERSAGQGILRSDGNRLLELLFRVRPTVLLHVEVSESHQCRQGLRVELYRLFETLFSLISLLRIELKNAKVQVGLGPVR